MSTENLDTACPLDCPDACSLTAVVEAGRLVEMRGNRVNPLTDGFICGKVRRFGAHVHSPERILRPLLRRGAKGAAEFAEIGWDEALDRVAAALGEVRARTGGEGILPYCYGGSNGYLSQDALDVRLFRRLGASRLARTVCAAGTGAAAAGLYGKMPGVALTDVEHAGLVVVWGANPHASGVHLLPRLEAARARGSRLVVVDPRRTPLAARADLHLAPRPGTDLVVALALIDWLFVEGRADLDFLQRHAEGWEELRRRAACWPLARAAEVAGVPGALLERFARLYADSAPALVRCGWGPERNRNGASAIAAILALPAVAGKFEVRGGGYTLSNSGAWQLDVEAAIAEPPPPTRIVNMNRLGAALEELDDPPIELLFVYNSNALATAPDQQRVRRGLARPGLFTVVFDQVLTDTACWADVVLPASTFAEHRELSRGYGAYALQLGRPVVPAVGESRSNHEVFGALLDRLRLVRAGDPLTEDEIVAALLRVTDGPRVARELTETGIAAPVCGANPIQFGDVFPCTPDRKVHLVPEDMDRVAPARLYGFQPDPGSERHPLALISPASGHRISSSFGHLQEGPAPVEISPTDAAVRGIATGDTVRIHNQLGEVHTVARISAALRPGVVSLEKGLWSRHTLNGATANALAPDTLADVGGGACFNDARVEIERLGAARAVPLSACLP